MNALFAVSTHSTRRRTNDTQASLRICNSLMPLVIVVVLSALLSPIQTLHAQGYSPAEAADRMTVLDGFQVDLIAVSAVPQPSGSQTSHC
jgi:hypothetical protein